MVLVGGGRVGVGRVGGGGEEGGDGGRGGSRRRQLLHRRSCSGHSGV